MLKLVSDGKWELDEPLYTYRGPILISPNEMIKAQANLILIQYPVHFRQHYGLAIGNNDRMLVLCHIASFVADQRPSVAEFHGICRRC